MNNLSPTFSFRSVSLADSTLARLQALTRGRLMGPVLAAALGGLATLGFSPFNVWPCVLAALVGLYFLWDGATPKRAFWLGWVFGLGHFISGMYWLYITIHIIGSAPVWLAIFLTGLLIAYLSFYIAVLGYVSARWGSRLVTMNALLLLPAGWAFLELVRGWALTGFPWLSLGYAFTDTALARLAPLGGVHAMGWVAALAAGGLWLLVRGPGPVRAFGATAVALVVLTAWLLPPPTSWTHTAGKAVPVAVVQGNVPEKEKWSRASFEPTLARYYHLTAAADRARVVVWPEAAVPALYQDVSDSYIAELRKLVRAHHQSLVFGILSARPAPGGKINYYNVARVIGEDQGVYAKRHLVPYGEYFPVPEFVRKWMEKMNLPYTNLTAGPPYQPMPTIAGEPVDLSICYEDLFGNEIRRDLPRARWLINITNDAWFGNTIAPHQHLEIARMRALEDGRYMLRAANTGISALIGPDGRVVKQVPQFKVAVLNASMTPRAGATPYVEIGDAPVWLASALACLLAMGFSLRQRRRGAE